MIVAFTGHRPNKIADGYRAHSPQRNWIEGKIRAHLRDYLKPDKAISGMALGVDQWAAQVCVDLGIPFVAAVPCDDQEKMWPDSSQKRYRRLLEKAAEVVVVSPGPYAGWKMQTRNEWMVDHADHVLAVWDGTSGGTGNCVAYAESKSKPITRFTPKDYYSEIRETRKDL